MQDKWELPEIIGPQEYSSGQTASRKSEAADAARPVGFR